MGEIDVPTVGVLALQGDVREHLRLLTAVGAHAVPVRRPEEVLSVDGLVLPGGESTTIGKLARTFEVLDPLRKRVATGMPVFGTCAGMILLADRVRDGVEDQEGIGGIDMTVRRNAFGRQIDSFEGDIDVDGWQQPYHAVFIRAPWVEEVGQACSVLARVSSGPATGRIVAVRQGQLLATAFHPELTDDPGLHDHFVRVLREG